MAGRSPTVRRRRLGLELQRLRKDAGLTIEQVAAALEVSDSKISRIETAQVGATPRDVRDMLALYRVPGQQRDWLMQLAREARKKAWWQQRFGNLPAVTIVGLQAAATSLRSYAPLVVPGLLQNRDYSSVVLSAIRPDLAPAEVEQRVELRMAGQTLLEQEGSLQIRAVIDEAAVRRTIGGPEMMRAQLERLIQAADLPNISLRVLPFTAGEHAGLDGQFDIIGFEEDADPDVLYLENTTRDLYLSDADAIRRYTMVFDHLEAAALGASESKEFLTSVVAAFR